MPPNPTNAPPSPASPATEAPISPVRAAILARMRAKKAAAAKPPPPAGRKPQELDSESRPHPSRHGRED